MGMQRKVIFFLSCSFSLSFLVFRQGGSTRSCFFSPPPEAPFGSQPEPGQVDVPFFGFTQDGTSAGIFSFSFPLKEIIPDFPCLPQATA